MTVRRNDPKFAEWQAKAEAHYAEGVRKLEGNPNGFQFASIQFEAARAAAAIAEMFR